MSFGKTLYLSAHPALTARCHTTSDTIEKILASPRLNLKDVNVFTEVPTCPLFKKTRLAFTINEKLKEKK